MLARQPMGIGASADDRAAWAAYARLNALCSTVAEAEALLMKPLASPTDEMFLDFSRTGGRERWQGVAFPLFRGALATLTLAECIEDKGRFIPELQRVLRVCCAQRTWVMPAHDRCLANFHGTITEIDLASAALAWDLATILNLLGNRLPHATRTNVADNIMRRVLVPFRNMIDGRQKPAWWLSCTNNWNAVCLAGVTGAALALLPSREERAWHVVAAREHVRNFLDGFTEDGYCSEGIGYWNYGFGHFVIMAETIARATKGRVDLMAMPRVEAIARFGFNMQTVHGVYPAFADCAVNARPMGELLDILCAHYGWKRSTAPPAAPSRGNLAGIMLSISRPPLILTGRKPPVRSWLRTWFADAGVLICRPREGIAGHFAFACKAGHNAEHHNHNDIGTFVVVVDSIPVLLDPGLEVYTSRTFSPDRYQSKVLNSFGHPVPVVAGQLQKEGADARGVVTRTAFGEKNDTVAVDLTAAYDLPSLKRLQRTFTYARTGRGSLVVEDTVAFGTPQTFGVALVTIGTWKRVGTSALRIEHEGEVVDVAIALKGDGGVRIHATMIDEDVRTPVKPTRIGITAAKPVVRASLRLTITPTM